jgi:hypothetical protein
MSYYKAPDNSLHFIEPEFAYMLPAGSVPITEAEAAAIRIANTPAQAHLSPLEQIRAIESAKADQTAKVMRQGMLLHTVSIAMARPDAQALTEGMTPEQAKAAVVSLLLATDPGFKLLHDLEQEIEPLRALVP